MTYSLTCTGAGGTTSPVSATVTVTSNTATTTTLAASTTTPTVGATVRLTATVAPSAATGTVTFYSGTTSLGTATLSSGVATLATSFATAGTDSLTVVYAGLTIYLTSTSSPVIVTVGATSADVTITVNPAQTHPISPWIYGINGSVPNVPDVTIYRLGGNRWTAYNWTTNASNAGSDYLYESDDYLTSSTIPGYAVYPSINADIAAGQATLFTIPIQGLVSADESGPVPTTNAPDLARFQDVVFQKSSVTSAPFTTTPPIVVVSGEDTGNVYSDEFVWAMNQLSSTKEIFSGTTSTPAFVDLDNEPDLWNSTHLEVQGPTEITPAAYIAKTLSVTQALKNQFPNMVIFGPVNYGFEGIYTWQGAITDTTPNGANWFADMYLQALSTASATYGRPLVDAYDFHWYPEDYDASGTRVTSMTAATLSDADMQLIVQAPRNLWDTTFNDPNNSNPWIYQSLGSTPVNILGRLQAKIASEFPSMNLSISEYETGGFNNIAGAVAQADQLGVYASQSVFAAMFWPPSGTFDYELAGFRAFRNFDGAGSNFGDVSLQSISSNPGSVMAYVSTDSATPGRVVIEAINRANTTQVAAISGLSLSGTASLYQMTAATASVQSTARNPVTPVSIGTMAVSGSTLTLTLPAYSVTTINVTGTAVAPVPAVTLSASPATIASGNSSTLTWSSTNATTCTASGGWTGTELVSGTKSVSPISTTTYSLTCTGTGGTSAPAGATVTVTAAAVPTVTLMASPATIASGNSSTLTWSSTSATSCTASDGWTGTMAASGMQSVSPASTTTYTLTCTGAGGTSAPVSATVTATTGSVFSIKVSGNTFVDGSGNVVQLRGVNLSGMEFVAIGGWDPSDPTGAQFGQPNNPNWSAIQSWKANIVRIPLNEDSWLALTCTDSAGVVHNADPGSNYKQTVTSLVQEANAAGLYVILDLHWAAPGDACPMLQDQMADADHSLDFWTSIANTYKNNPAVLFELFNEPFLNFDFSGDDGSDAAWNYLMFATGGNEFTGYPESDDNGDWVNVTAIWNIASYQAMINAVRATGATNVVLIGSDNYTSDLSGWLSHVPTDSAKQMAATWHPYPSYGENWQNPCTGSNTYCTPNYSPQVYTYAQGILKAGYPVLSTETGDQNTAGTVGSPFVVNVAAFSDAPGTASTSTEPGVSWPAVSGLPAIGLIGWTWDVWGDPDNVLIQDVNGTPTVGYGQFFQSWMVNHK